MTNTIRIKGMPCHICKKIINDDPVTIILPLLDGKETATFAHRRCVTNEPMLEGINIIITEQVYDPSMLSAHKTTSNMFYEI